MTSAPDWGKHVARVWSSGTCHGGAYRSYPARPRTRTGWERSSLILVGQQLHIQVYLSHCSLQALESQSRAVRLARLAWRNKVPWSSRASWYSRNDK